MLNHRPCNGQTIKGTGASADLIQDQQTFGSGIPKDIGYLRHLHHKGTLAAGQVVGSPYPGKDPVYNADIGLAGRYKRTDLGHKDDQRRLPHISRFSRHIWTGDHRDTVFPIVQIGVIGNKHIIGDHLLHHRMAAVFNVNDPPGIDLWPYILISGSHQSHRQISVQFCNSPGSLLDTIHLSGDHIPYLCKPVIFQSVELVFCSQDHILQFL